MKVQGVIFDVDGVLLDSMGIWSVIGSKFLDSLGIQHEKNIDDVLKTMTMPQATLYLKNKFKINFSDDEIKIEIRKVIDRYYKDEVKLKNGVLGFLKYLHENKIKVCVATANNYKTVHNVFKRLEIDKYFIKIFSCEELECDKRNSSKVFDMALDCLNMNKKNVIVFEDSLYAIETAKKANYWTVGIFDEYEKKNWASIKNLSDYCFENLDTAKDFFAGNQFVISKR